MDTQLIRDIEIELGKIPGCNFLSDEAGTKMIIEVAERFSLDTRQLFMWDTKVYGKVYDYDNNPDQWLPILSNLLDRFEEWIYLVVTAEEFFPWKVIHVRKGDCTSLLSELPFFEYFIFDVSMLLVVFETHHNAFVVFEKEVTGPRK